MKKHNKNEMEPYIYRGIDNTIDIFADASTTNVNGYNAPAGFGYIALQNGFEIDRKLCVLSNCPSGLGEITAIKLAVLKALSLRKSGFTGTINIFTDYLNAVNAIKEYVYQWRMSGNIVYKNGSYLEEVAYQKEYVEIVRTIVENGLYVNFFYQPGHCDRGNSKKRKEAKEKFIKKNDIDKDKEELLSKDFINYICDANNQVDIDSRWYLRRQVDALNNEYKQPFYFTIPEDQLNYYQTELKKYVNKKGELINHVQ